MSDLVHRLALETPEFYISPFGKINHRLVNLSYNFEVKSELEDTHINNNFKVREILHSNFILTTNKCSNKGYFSQTPSSYIVTEVQNV